MIASVDIDALLELVWAAPLAVLAVTVAWGLVIRGATGAAEASRDGRALPAVLSVLVGLAGAALFVAALAYGLLIMLSKG